MAIGSPTDAPGTTSAPVEEAPRDDTVIINGHEKKMIICVDGNNIVDKLRGENKLVSTIKKIQDLLDKEYFGGDRKLAENESAKIDSEKGVISDGSGKECHTFQHMENGKQTTQGEVFSKIQDIIQGIFKELSKDEGTEGPKSPEGTSGERDAGSSSSSGAVDDEEEEVPTKIKIVRREVDSEPPEKPVKMHIASSGDGASVEDLEAQVKKMEGDLAKAVKQKAERDRLLQEQRDSLSQTATQAVA